MKHQHGFSFVEILISLYLIVTLSLGLFSEQTLIKRRLNTMQNEWQNWLNKSNAIERHYFQFQS